jgi:hypothetical protein
MAARGLVAGRVRVRGFGLGFGVRGFGPAGVRRAPLSATLVAVGRGREVGQAVGMGAGWPLGSWRWGQRPGQVGAGVKVAVVELRRGKEKEVWISPAARGPDGLGCGGVRSSRIRRREPPETGEEGGAGKEGCVTGGMEGATRPDARKRRGGSRGGGRGGFVGLQRHDANLSLERHVGAPRHNSRFRAFNFKTL